MYPSSNTSKKTFNANKLIWFWLLISISTVIYADSAPLIFDAVNRSGIPRNFRNMDNVTPNVGAHAIASAQFSEDELKSVLSRISGPVVIVDLREESHGFLNGNAISWAFPYNWGNLNKSSKEIEKDQTSRLDKLGEAKKVPVNFSLSMSENGKLALCPYNLLVKHVFSEEELARKYHVGYFRLYVADNRRPTESEVNHFVNFARTLPPNTTLYFHCRAGSGRTTTFMVMYDMMYNARALTYHQILQRQFLIGGKKLLDLPRHDSYKYPYALERIKFLQDFYKSCASKNILKGQTVISA